MLFVVFQVDIREMDVEEFQTANLLELFLDAASADKGIFQAFSYFLFTEVSIRI